MTSRPDPATVDQMLRDTQREIMRRHGPVLTAHASKGLPFPQSINEERADLITDWFENWYSR